MAEVKFQKGSEEWYLFMDFWNLCQKHWNPEDNDEFWEKLIDDINAFTMKYNTNFATKLAHAFLENQEFNLKKNI